MKNKKNRKQTFMVQDPKGIIDCARERSLF